MPTTLAIALDEYFAGHALVGLLASQKDEPDQRWVCAWSFRMGRLMALEARKRRFKRLKGTERKRANAAARSRSQ